MKEVNRIVFDSIELRIMKGHQEHWCEIFEFGNWCRVSAIKLHQLSFDKKIYDWINQNYKSTNINHKVSAVIDL